MIYIERKQPKPKTLKTKKDLYSEEFISALEKDFHNKCYICEGRIPAINVEHFKPTKFYPELEFVWENLYLSCERCNKIKGTKSILDCTDKSVEIESRIKYECSSFRAHDVKIELANGFDDDLTKGTINILEIVYNGNTPIRERGTNLLRKALIDEMIIFQELFENYEDAKFNEDERKFYENRISNKLSQASPFAAFKRQIIKDTPE